jgi:tRNA pseudouridine55 synthase
MTDPAGLLPVDKPEGPTSHDVVARARRALGIRRIGHTGTLDPFASGLLLLCIGSATRLAEYLADLPKSYRAVLRLGAATNTDDRTGTTTDRSDAWRDLDPEHVRQITLAQVGTRLQTPPRFSARKVEGERLYRLARKGVAVDPSPSEVTIHSVDLLRVELPDVEFEITCSTGTYIRAIARDIGAQLKTFGYLESLRRVRIGPYDVRNALRLDQLTDGDAVRRALVSPLAALGHMAVIEVTEEESRRLMQGVALVLPPSAPSFGPAALSCESRLIAVGEITNGWIRPRKVFV